MQIYRWPIHFEKMGRPTKVDDQEILQAIALSPDPVVTAPELSEKLGYSNDGIRHRLESLQDNGLVKSRDVGARATIWWLTSAGRENLS